jgi:predicted NAD/FAD-dependent oxidoreductase
MAKRTVLYDASDEDAVRKAQQDEADRENDLAFVVSSPRGRRWLYALIHDACHFERLSHVPGDTYSTAFNEGARSVGVALLDAIRDKHTPQYFQMLEENTDV